MVDAKQEKIINKKESKGSKKIIKTMKWMSVLAIFGGVGYGLWQNPQLSAQVRQWLNPYVDDEKENETAELKNEIDNLRNEVRDLRLQVYKQQENSELIAKFEKLEQFNMNVINSKADVEAVLGLVMRMDKAEKKLESVAGATNKGAIILTAAMMVKETAARGGSFEYEAEVLKQVAGGNLELKEQVAQVVKYGKTGLPNDRKLINEFQKIYKNLSKKQRENEEKDWKDRINNKLSEYIKVKKTNEAQPVFKNDETLNIIRKEVVAGNFKKALVQLHDYEAKFSIKDEDLQNWKFEAENKVKFDDAISKIAMYYLAALKINNIN